MSTSRQVVWVIGAGVIGRGVAQDCAEHGLEVVLVDRDPGVLDAARTEIRTQIRLFAMLRRRYLMLL